MICLRSQIHAMAKDYPELKITARSNLACLWKGPIKPYLKVFQISIYYRPPIAPETFTCGLVQPLVQVHNPVLERHMDYEEGPIPHIYKNERQLLLPYLCLFDPENQEWTPEDLLTETTIPWTERWLINYEFWLATGFWEGGGKHIEQENQKSVSNPTEEEIGGVMTI